MPTRLSKKAWREYMREYRKRPYVKAYIYLYNLNARLKKVRK